MTPWTRRTIGPGRNRDAAPTQPLEDPPAAAHGCWLPSDALADAMQAPDPDAAHWERVAEYAIMLAVGFALGVIVSM